MLHQKSKGEGLQPFKGKAGIIQDLNYITFLSSLLPNAFFQVQNVPKLPRLGLCPTPQ